MAVRRSQSNRPPSPPRVPPTQIAGAAVNERIAALERRRSLEEYLRKTNTGQPSHHQDQCPMTRANKSPFTTPPTRPPDQRNQHKISYPDTKPSLTRTRYRSTPTKVESDYELMLPQFTYLTTTSPTTSQYSNEEDETSSSSYSSSSSSSSVVVFTDRSTLFMRPSSDYSSETIYSTIPDPLNSSSDSGFSQDIPGDPRFSQDIPGDPISAPNNNIGRLASDEISIVSRYQRVLQSRAAKKSRFKKLSELLCSGGSATDEECDSLYDSIPSPYSSTYQLMTSLDHPAPSETIPSPSSCKEETTEESETVRFTKQSFFYRRHDVSADYVTMSHLSHPPKPARSTGRRAEEAGNVSSHLYENLSSRDHSKRGTRDPFIF